MYKRQRETPDAVQRIIDSKKKGEETTSRRRLPYADPKLYRVSEVTNLGLYHLEDPATGQVVAGYREALPADRLIRYTDLPPQENPLNADEELWIEIKSNDIVNSDTWLLRKIEAQCDTGEVRVAAADGSDSQIINLPNYSYHFVKPPRSAASSTASESDLKITEDQVQALFDSSDEDSEYEGFTE